MQQLLPYWPLDGHCQPVTTNATFYSHTAANVFQFTGDVTMLCAELYLPPLLPVAYPSSIPMIPFEFLIVLPPGSFLITPMPGNS